MTMNITIQRLVRTHQSVDGILSIHQRKVCDTAECPTTALPAGLYEVELTPCHQHQRRILRLVPTRRDCKPKCHRCALIPDAGPNTRMPRVCPMITMGNGVIGRNDGSIIVGKRALWGLLLHSRKTYDKLYTRIRKAMQRGTDVQVEIVEE